MTLSAEDRALYETRLKEAEQAMHELAIGQSARVFVDQNGERVEYAFTDVSRLRGYILSLKSALGKPLGLGGPINFRV
jgi:hypothetical protein